MNNLTIIIGIIVVIIVLYFIIKPPLIEGYGGPIRNVRKIPITTCNQICDMQYNICRADMPYDNAGYCARRFNGCRAECYYSTAQRF
jgi:hypothetical protein